MRRCRKCDTPLRAGTREDGCLACAAIELLSKNEGAGVVTSNGPGTAQRVGDYALLNEIARGGMGIVFRARQPGLDRIVALKMIREGAWANLTLRRRFLAEARLAAQLRHPNIVAVHEIGEHEGLPFFSMELVEGPNLAEFAGGHPLAARAAAELLIPIADAVHFAHGHGILHRDLKPQNILLDEAGQPHVTDFGLAQELGQEQGLTLTGQLLGSPAFMSPEQTAGRHERLVPATDVYSLGALLYYLLAARAPFEATSLADLLSRIRDEEPTPLRQINPSVPADLETICLKCLQKDPAHRYCTAAELAADLGRFLRDEAVFARRLSPAERAWRWCRCKPALAALGAVAVTALIAALAGAVVASRRAAAIERVGAENRASRAEQLLVEARQARQRPQAGQRALALSLIGRARQLNNNVQFLDRLRDEAIACLIMPDVRFEAVEWFGRTNTAAGQPGAFAFSQDLRVRAGWEGTNIIVRRARDGIELGRLSSRFGPPTRDDFGPKVRIREVSSSGRWVALENEANAHAAVWDLRRYPARRAALMTNHCVGFAGFLNGEERFPAFAGADGSLRVCDLKNKQHHELGIMSWTMQKPTVWAPFWHVRQLVVGNDGRFGVASIRDRERPFIALFDLPADRLLRRIEMEFLTQDMSFNPGGDCIIAVGSQRRTDVLDTLSGRRLITIDSPCLQPGVGLSGRSLGLFWHDHRLMEARLEGAQLCREWHPAQDTNPASGEGRTTNPVSGLTFSADGRFLAVIAPPGIRLLDLAANRTAGGAGCDDSATACFLSARPSLLVTGPRQITRLNLVPRLFQNVLTLDTSRTDLNEDVLGEAAFNTRGSVMAVAQPRRHHVGLFDAADLGLRGSIGPLTNVSRLALSGDGRWLATASDGGGVQIWNAQTGACVEHLTAPSDARFALSPEGRWLAITGKSAWEIHEVQRSATVATLPRPFDQRFTSPAAAFSPDGRWLAVSASESSVALVDTRDWRIAATLAARTPTIFSTLAFNRDASSLAAGGAEGRVCIWSLSELESELAALRLGWRECEKSSKVRLASASAPPLFIHHAGTWLPEFPIRYPTSASDVALPGDYNLRRDFSITMNPAGVWTYGWKTNLTKEFNAFAIPRRSAQALNSMPGGQSFIWCDEVGRQPALLFQPCPEPRTYTLHDPNTGENRTWNLPPALAYLELPAGERDPDGAWAGVRFTAPQTRTYEIQVRIHSLPQFQCFQDTTRTEFAIIREGAPLATRMIAPGNQDSLECTTILKMGQAVEFLCRTQARKDAASAAIALDVEVYRR